ncbi:hypothetical protein CY35_08G136100 [Sphagnum magellanicum]|nr:hypothetical protein CY35_08G136100 [Sphagnum magellanicum]
MALRTPLKARVQSPGPHLLTPNDDDAERAQMRVARATTLLRKSGMMMAFDFEQVSTPQRESNVLSRDRILELHNNCIKLAAENKITQRNTWDLKLIDHLSTLVKGGHDDEDQTNFQKASCTLEAGVKIYSTRVDSVHTEAYKVLGGLNRTAGATNDNSQFEDVDNGKGGEDNEDEPRKDLQKKMGNRSSTLEESFANLNVKKFDVAFTADPLFHQMSAQFDEDDIECVRNSLLKVTEISPTLKEILKMLDDPYRAAVEDEAYSGSPARRETEFPWQENHGAFSGEDGDEISTIDSHSGFNDYEEGRGSLEGFQDVVNSTPQMGSWSEVTPDLDDFEGDLGDGEVEDSRVGDIMRHGSVEWLTASFGQSTQANAWAGPDHWKYHKPRDAQHCMETVEVGCTEGSKKKRKKRQHFVLDFENSLELDMSKFGPPENPNSTLLVHRGGSCSSLLPPDLHYEALNLVTLFLKPTVQCLGKWGRPKSDKARPKGHCAEDYDMDSGNDERAPLSDGCWPEENDHGELDNLFENDLINAPPKVRRISINYRKTSKQVDVHMLKATLWEGLQHKQECAVIGEEFSQDEGGISFQDLLDFLPEDCPAAAQEDISVHICFLCLLHLANEHNLCIKDCSTMDELRIFQVDKHAALASDVGDG